MIQIQAQIPPDQTGKVQPLLDDAFGLENGDASFNSQSVGPTFGQQVANKAVIAIIFSLLVISAYVAIRFEAKYAVPVLIALVHDILITAGVYALVGREVTSGTVAAFLTILGYSMYDTIIVFDRVRENVPRMPRAAFSQIVNRSMSEVLTRSLITGLSTVFLIGVLLIFGGDDAPGLRLRDDGRGRLRYVLVDLHRLAGADRMEGARTRLPIAPRADQGGDGLRADVPGGQRRRADRRGRAPHGRGRRSATAAAPPWRRATEPETAPATAPVAVADPPLSARRRRRRRAPRRTGDGVAGRPEAGGRAHQAAAEAAEEAVAPPAQAREEPLMAALMASGLVHHRGRPLALHRLPPGPLLGRDRRRAARRRRRRADHGRDRADR